METNELIPAEDFCLYHQLETEFIALLQQEGLVQISIINQKTFIPLDELPQLERMVHLHRDLDINVAGVASIIHLLQKMDILQNEIALMRNRLRRYED
jgi:hypothetical protein